MTYQQAAAVLSPEHQQVQHSSPHQEVYWSPSPGATSSAAPQTPMSMPQEPTTATSGDLYGEQLRQLQQNTGVSPQALTASPWSEPSSPVWPSDGQPPHLTVTPAVLEPVHSFPRRSSFPCWSPTSPQQPVYPPQLSAYPTTGEDLPNVSTLLFNDNEDLHRYEFSGAGTPPSGATQFALRPVILSSISPSSTISSNTSSPTSIHPPSLDIPRRVFISPTHEMSLASSSIRQDAGVEEVPAPVMADLRTAKVLGSPLQLDQIDLGIVAIDEPTGQFIKLEAAGPSMSPPPMNAPVDVISVMHTDDAASKETDFLRRRCFNCHSTDPPSWRRSTLSPGKIVSARALVSGVPCAYHYHFFGFKACNKCGLYERTHGRPRPLRFDELSRPIISPTVPRPKKNSKSSATGAPSTGKVAVVSPKSARKRKGTHSDQSHMTGCILIEFFRRRLSCLSHNNDDDRLRDQRQEPWSTRLHLDAVQRSCHSHRV